MKIEFTKMHGAGNDYIYVNTLKYPLVQPEAFAKEWSKPHTGIGSDGLVLIGPSEKGDFSMRIFNADGSEAMMCGNASRCVGKYLYEYGLTDKKEIALETLSGIKTLYLHLQGENVDSVTVDMGAPRDIRTVDLGNGYLFREGTAVNMGNPHLVIFTHDVSAIDLPSEGPSMEHHPLFPNRVNVEFAQILPDGNIRMRVWERGSGITQACGTGACATAVAAAFTGRGKGKTDIIMDGGTLTIEYQPQNDRVLMTGPATKVFDGTINIYKNKGERNFEKIENEHYLKLPGNYLFSDIAKKINTFKVTHPGKRLIRLGIGDVTRPLPQACITAMHKAVDEMSKAETFHGYGPEQGYDFLIEAILKNDFASRGISLSPTEIFINDGAKSDTGNIGEVLRWDNSMGVTDPIYPVYIDSNVMCGRSGELGEDGKWSNVTYLPCTAENHFIPQIPDRRIDIIYLCYPNNPTGTTLAKAELKKWVDYALANDTLIFFDAAYEAYIREDDVPHSIYEIKGAKRCAIEFRSFSKTAGFTGVRCGYTVVPKELTAATLDGERVSVNKLWNRRQCTKFNGTSYITQRGAEAIYTAEGKAQVKATINYYMENARIMREGLQSAGFKVYGGVNAPYIWLKTPDNTGSWRFFEQLLYEVNVVGTPGVAFASRLSANAKTASKPCGASGCGYK